MASGDITLIGSPLGMGNAVTRKVTAGNQNRLGYAPVASAEYGINGNVVVRAALNTGEIFAFNHWFSQADADLVRAMAHICIQRESDRVFPYHIFLTDERCQKVPDTNPPTYAYIENSLTVSPDGITTKSHRIYKAVFRNGPPIIGEVSRVGVELIFEMQIADPYFAAEQLPPPPLSVFNVQAIAENIDTSGGPIFVADYA